LENKNGKTMMVSCLDSLHKGLSLFSFSQDNITLAKLLAIINTFAGTHNLHECLA